MFALISPWCSWIERAVSDDQTRFDPTDPLVEHGIGWRLHTLDLRLALLRALERYLRYLYAR
jgi:hypothetical protein